MDLTGRTYHRFSGGREDLALSVGPRLDYAISPSIGTSLTLRRIEQVSTVRAAAYGAFVVSAQWTLALSGGRDPP